MSEYFVLDKTNVKVEFNITGDEFTLENITSKLDIEPSQFWKKNDPFPQSDNALRKDSFFGICIGYEESIDTTIQVEKILDKLLPKKEMLLLLKDNFDLNYKMNIIINIEENKTPAVCIEKNSSPL